MVTSFTRQPTRAQRPLLQEPYDRWINAGGDVTAEFYRVATGYLVRFPALMDFEIDADTHAVSCAAVDAPAEGLAATFFANSIVPILANHRGTLNLHGSAVAIDGCAVAFIGPSRRGKTTLAGALARAGYPFLTEDVIGLVPAGRDYLLQPSRPLLRLFHDSAAFLTGGDPGWSADDGKDALAASALLPYRESPTVLEHIFVLGPGEATATRIQQLSHAEAVSNMMQQSFILDVEDRKRLGEHFQRIANLIERVPCYWLDYPRTYEQLPDVIGSIVELTKKKRVQT